MNMIEQGFQAQIQQAEQMSQVQSVDQGGSINASPEAVDMAEQMIASGQV